MRIAVLHGPNLNLLGTPELENGSTSLCVQNNVPDTLAEVNRSLEDLASDLKVRLICIFQTNHEGHLIDKIHELKGSCEGIVINAGLHTVLLYSRCLTRTAVGVYLSFSVRGFASPELCVSCAHAIL